MKARIIGQNHNITTYEVNGKRRYIIEDIPQTTNRKIVNMAIKRLGSREWAVVYNYLDSVHAQNSMPLALEKTIDSMTY